MAPKRNHVTYGRQPTTKRRRHVNLAPTDIDIDLLPADSVLLAPMNNHTPPPLTQRPESQKAATMTVEPSQSAIAEVVSFTMTTVENASRWLSVTNNDAQKAVNLIIDDADFAKYKSENSWEEGLMHADREGNQYLQPLGSSANPTRGNSPAPSLSSQHPKTKSDEDRDLEAALAASRVDAEVKGGQETGIVDLNGTEVKKFGPATQEEYDSDKWAMVHVAQEVVPDVPLADRRHQAGKPRFLKHLPDGDYTPNLLTICHAIPQARTCLLMNKYEKDDYGFDQDWWRGHPIAMPQIVSTADQSPAEPDADGNDELVTEVQRLMAFLDSSNRAYATIGALTQTEAVRDNSLAFNAGSLLELLLNSWRTAALRCVEDGASYQDDTPSMQTAFERLFISIVGTDDPDGMDNKLLGLWDLKLDSDPDKDGLTHIFELLSGLLWSDDLDLNNYIETPADVLVMKINQEKAGCKLGVDVPPAFYLDKYLKENIKVTQNLRRKMSEAKARLSKIAQIEQKLNSWAHPTKATRIDAGLMLKHTVGHFSGQNRKDIDEADQSNSAPLGHEVPEESSAIAEQLARVMASVEDKLDRLKVEKDKIQKLVVELSVSNPPGLKESDLKHRYTLRGVATKPNVTYVLRPKSKDSLQMTEDDDTEMLLPKQADEEQYEWWRIEYTVNGPSASISNEVFTPEESVLQAVQVEHNSALLVYASDDACEPVDDDGLPEALQKFITRDNDAFQAELNRPPAYRASTWDDLNDIPRASIERRGSNDSTAAVGSEHDCDEIDVRQHSGFGLGYEVGQSRNAMELDGVPQGEDRPPTPVHEIVLDEQVEGVEMEMVEKAHEPLVPRTQVNGAVTNGDGDVTMGGVGESQDAGVGGANGGR